MKKFYLALMCFASLSIMTACSSSKTDQVIDGFEDLIEEVESKKGKMTADEWEVLVDDFNQRFEDLGIEEINEEELSAMQKLKIVGLTLRWSAAMAENAPSLIEAAIENAEEQAAENQATESE